MTVSSRATAVAGRPEASSGDNARQAVIETRGLTKRYGDRTAVRDLNLAIYEGEVFGLLGPNGAGKTTTILMLMGLTEPSSGNVRVLGHDPVRNPIAVKRGVGYLPENIGFYDDMTGFENLMYTAKLNGLSADEAAPRIESLLETVGLAEAGGRPVKVYSRGMRQRLGLADVLVKQPRIAILDEPTLGIDPAGIQHMLRLIARLAREEKVTVLISSHLLHQVQQICHRVGIFVGGELIAEGAVDDLSRQLTGEAPFVFALEAGDASATETGQTAGGAAPAGADAIERLLRQVDGVVDAERDGRGGWLVHCRNDVRGELARAVITGGFSLRRLDVHTRGLDDVYRAYFEGRATDGRHAS